MANFWSEKTCIFVEMNLAAIKIIARSETIVTTWENIEEQRIQYAIYATEEIVFF